MRAIIRNIERKRNLDVNLTRYAAGMEKSYARYSKVRLAMNYYSANERYSEDPASYSFIECLPLFHHIVKETILGDASAGQKKEAIQTLYGMRDGIIDTMKTATAYADIFYIYEYVLNRQEYRFKEGELPKGYTDEDFTRDIMHYIVSDEDKSVINSKISEVIGQLPLRLTKQKFFEYLNNGLSIYLGSDKKALDDFLYRIRTSAMIERPDSFYDELTELYEIRETLTCMDYAKIDKEAFDSLSDALKEAVSYLNEVTDAYVSVAELINDAIVILLAETAEGGVVVLEEETPAAADRMEETSRKREEACMQIMKEVCGCFLEEEGDMEAASDILVFLEGEQEHLMEQLNSNCFILNDWYQSNKDELSDYGLLARFQALDRMANLTSGSVFAELEETDGDGKEEISVDEVYLQEKKDILYNDLSGLWNECGRPVMRAVMATVVSELPVFFQNISELQDFIYQCLNQCRDKSEKLACIEILNGIMDEADD